MTSLLASIAFLADAAAPAAAPAGDPSQSAPGGGNMMMIGVYALFIGGFYFLMIRPQQKKAKETARKQSELKTGDRVATSAGIIGKVVSIDDKSVTLQVSESVKIPFQRQHITEFLTEEAKA